MKMINKSVIRVLPNDTPNFSYKQSRLLEGRQGRCGLLESLESRQGCLEEHPGRLEGREGFWDV